MSKRSWRHVSGRTLPSRARAEKSSARIVDGRSAENLLRHVHQEGRSSTVSLLRRHGEGKRIRLPAGELEAHVFAAIKGYLSNPHRVLDDFPERNDDITATLKALSEWRPWDRSRWSLAALHSSRSSIRKPNSTSSWLRPNSRSSWKPQRPAAIQITYPIRLHRTAHDLRLVIPAATGEPEADSET